MLPVKYVHRCLVARSQVEVAIADRKLAARRLEVVQSSADLHDPAVI